MAEAQRLDGRECAAALDQKTAARAAALVEKGVQPHLAVVIIGDDPASQANNVKALQGMDGMLRLRVGDWRIVMCDGVVLEILDIKVRGSAYKE